MSRRAWSLYAYRLLMPGEQLDLFACQEVRLHLVARQLELEDAGDHTLCGSLLPARPHWRDLDRQVLKDHRLCSVCLQRLRAERHGLPRDWPLR